MHRRIAGALIAAAVAGVALWGQAGEPGLAVHLGSYRWSEPGDWFGGLSGLDLQDDGAGFVAVTDRGMLVTGQVTRDASGLIDGVTDLVVRPVQDSEGRKLTAPNTDAEGLAILPGGAIALSFEGNARVMVHAGPDAPGRFAGDVRVMGPLQANSGMEALAVDPQGRLVTMPERSGAVTQPFPVWRLEDGFWRQAFQFTRQGGFLPVGADYGPDGRLYVLEREFNGFGFASRLRRFPVQPTGVETGEALFTTRTGTHDNLESVAVWRDDQGRLRATMVSDDNFHFLQRTELVDYLLPE